MDKSPTQIKSLTPPRADIDEISAWLNMIGTPGQVIELRIPGAAGRKNRTDAGYFDDLSALAKAAANYSSKAPGVYITLNPVKPALLSRYSNRVEQYAKNLTSDRDIFRRCWLPVDIDATRPAGISSSDKEYQAAHNQAAIIQDWLELQGWPAPIMASSGNGAHLLYRIDLPAEDGGLVERCLKALAFRFDDENVNVDQTTYNPARIWKVYGTLCAKGDNTPERPHRLAHIIEAPAELVTVSVDQLEDLAKKRPQEPPRARQAAQEFDLEKWIHNNDLPVATPKPWQGGRRWIFEICPWNSDHTDRSAYIVQFASGAIAAGCHHNGCSGKDWRALRAIYDKPGQDGAGPPDPLSQTAIYISDPNEKTILESGQGTLTDSANAERLARDYGDILRYVPGWGWLIWDGKRWQRDVGSLRLKYAKLAARAIYTEAATAFNDDQAKAIGRWAGRSLNISRLDAMFASAKDLLPEKVEDFDRDPSLLNVENGILDLRTGELGPHDPKAKLTKIAGAHYDPEATCPRWLSFLDRIMAGDAEMIAFLQRAVGYGLTGDVSEQALFFLHGSGANGKTTFILAVLSIMGEYGREAAPQLIIAGNRHPTELADLIGARFVSTIEVEEGARMAEVMVKQLTGGDRMKARFMRQDWFEFEPTHKIYLVANHKPEIAGRDYAIWRRIKLIPFEVTIPESEQDPHLIDKLREELPGIMAWAVEGCLAWQREGLNFPEKVTAATEAYRGEMDVLGRFLSECCVTQPGVNVTAGELLAAYNKFTGDMMHNVRFSRLMRQRGFSTNGRDGAGRAIYPGIGLISEAFRDSEAFEAKSSISNSKSFHEGVIPKVASDASDASENLAEPEDLEEWEI